MSRAATLPNLLVLLSVLLFSVPTFGLLITALRAPADLASSGWWEALARPADFTLDNFRLVLTGEGMGRAFLNSLFIAVPATLLTILLGALAAFPLSHLRFRGRESLFATFLALQIVPIQMTLVPVLDLLKALHLAGTFPGVWLAHTAYGLPFAIYLLRKFFTAVPTELIKVAEIDGASQGQIFRLILLPLSRPALATLAIFQFLWVWNDLLVALVYLGGHPARAPLTVRMASLMGSLQAADHILAAAAFLSMALPLLLFALLQRTFLKGLLSGALKG